MLFRQIINPVYVTRRLALWNWERRNPNRPWLAAGAIELLERFLRPTDVGLEYGSGRSTTWLARHCGRLTSVEQDEVWFNIVRQQLCAGSVTNTDLLHIPLEHTLEELWHQRYNPMPAYVDVASRFPDHGLDFVLIDGSYREACITAAAPKIKVSGLMVLDNANWHPMEHWKIPGNFQLIHQSSNVKTATAVFLRRS